MPGELMMTLLLVPFISSFIFVDFYFYIETDPPRKPGDKARLKSPPFQAFTGKHVQHWFSFWYFMWGTGVNELRVVLEDNTGSRIVLWSTDGDHERKWLNTNVTFDIPRSSSGADWFSLVFEGIAGADQQSDIAIDTIKASPSMCRDKAEPKGKRNNLRSDSCCIMGK